MLARALLAGSLLLAGPSGPAEGLASSKRPSLVVDVARGSEACVDVELPRLHESIELSLGYALEHRGAAPAQPGDTHVQLACVRDPDRPEAAPAIELWIDDPQTGIVATRSLEAPSSDDPHRRAELLGLAVAELVRGTWLTLADSPAPLAPADTTRSSQRTRARARNIARRPTAPWLIGDAFVVRSYLGAQAPTIMLGEQVELLHRPLQHLAWKIDGELAYWRVPVEGGRVNSLSITVAPALLSYGELGGASRPGRPGRVAIYGGAGARLGAVRLRGRPEGDAAFERTQGVGAFGGPLAMARVEVSCGRWVRVGLVGEAGWALLGPDRPDALPVRVRGPWIDGAFVIVSAF